MDLSDLNIPMELQAPQTFITCQVEGLVDEGDLRRLAAGSEHSRAIVEPGDLKKLREKHHSVARLVAAGMPQATVAAITGYTPTYISLLLNNPAMQELLTYYRSAHTNAAEVIGERLRTAGLGALEKLQDKLDDKDGDGLDDQVLLGLAKLGLDRSGHGPQSKVQSVTEHHIIDHAELRRLNQAARAASREDIITDLTALPAPTLSPDLAAQVEHIVDAAIEEISNDGAAEL